MAPARRPARPASRSFRVTFVLDATGQRHQVVVDPANPPTEHDGLPGSLLQIALSADVPIEHACGGVAVCGNCHVIVAEGLNTCPPTTEEEEDRLDQLIGLTPHSRLACQTVPDGSADVVVHVPA